MSTQGCKELEWSSFAILVDRKEDSNKQTPTHTTVTKYKIKNRENQIRERTHEQMERKRAEQKKKKSIDITTQTKKMFAITREQKRKLVSMQKCPEIVSSPASMPRENKKQPQYCICYATG